MNKVAFTIFGIEIMWYGLIITSAMILAAYLSANEGKKQGFKFDDFFDIALYSLPFAILCARAYYVIFNLDSYSTFMQVINIREGGLAIHGGLFGGFVAGIAVAIYKKMNVLKSADIIAPFLALAQSIGRWGNYINQEAYGVETDLPWAININGMMVHPTFLYESIWNFFTFIVLYRFMKNKKFDGQIVAMYFITYSVGRFFIESLRTDSLMFFGLRTAQIMSLLLIAVGLGMLYKFKNNGIKPPYNR